MKTRVGGSVIGLVLSIGCGAAAVEERRASIEPQDEPQIIVDARAMHDCDGAGAGTRACGLLDRFAASDAAPLPTEGRSYFGHASCAGGEDVDLLEAAFFLDAPSPSVYWKLSPTGPGGEPPTEVLRALLTAPDYDVRAFERDGDATSDFAWLLRTRGHFLPPAGTVPVQYDDASAALTADRENWGTTYVRADGDRLLVVEPLAVTPPTICVAELEPFRTFEADVQPVVTCLSELSRRPTATSFSVDGCEDGHVYAVECEASRCTCARDGETSIVEVAEGTPVRDVMRYGCGFPIAPAP